MEYKERVKLVVKEWFYYNTAMTVNDDKLNLLVSRIAGCKQCDIPVVVSSLTAKDKLYLNTLLVNKLLEKEANGTYKTLNDIGIMDKINDLMEKVNNS